MVGEENGIQFKVRSDDGDGVHIIIHARAVNICTDCYHIIIL